jgi:hypothetical protein
LAFRKVLILLGFYMPNKFPWHSRWAIPGLSASFTGLTSAVSWSSII